MPLVVCAGPYADEGQHEERQEIGTALAADRVERERRNDERGGRRVRDHGPAARQHDDQRDHGRDGCQRDDVLHEAQTVAMVGRPPTIARRASPASLRLTKPC